MFYFFKPTKFKILFTIGVVIIYYALILILMQATSSYYIPNPFSKIIELIYILPALLAMIFAYNFNIHIYCFTDYGLMGRCANLGFYLFIILIYISSCIIFWIKNKNALKLNNPKTYLWSSIMLYLILIAILLLGTNFIMNINKIGSRFQEPPYNPVTHIIN